MTTTGSPELLMRQRLAALTRVWSAAESGEVRGIHQARVATRRLREALPLVADGSRRRRLNRKVRKLTRALGPIRELDVALLNIDELAAVEGMPQAALTALREVIGQERRLRFKEMRHRFAHVDLRRLQKHVLAAARNPSQSPPQGRAGGRRTLDAARRRAARRAVLLSGAIDSAAGVYLPDRLHEVRIAVKKLRYVLEVVKQLSGSRAVVSLRTLKRAQELLGHMHDLEILITRARGVQSTATVTSLRRSAELDQLVRRLETMCRQQHGHYMTMRPALLATCARVIATAERTGAATAA